MKLMLLTIILILSVFVVFGRTETKPKATPKPKTHIKFTNRTEVALALTIDGVEMCTAESMSACEGIVAYGPHKLAAVYRGKELITRDSKPKEYSLFTVCHAEDMTPICQPQPPQPIQ